MSTPIQCLVGLGNPTEKYVHTRHNVGFWFVDQVAKQAHTTFRQERKFSGKITKVGQTWLLKPELFMNRSGHSVRAISQFYQIPIEQILVIHDDIDLPVGTAKLKRGGGHGGHNGLRDIINQTGSRDFLRLRLGVGRPAHSSEVVNYVLKAPSIADKKHIQYAIDNSLSVLELVLDGQLEQAMQILHSA